MKKILFAIVAVFALLFNHLSFANEKLPQEYFEFSKTAIEKYFKNRDMNENNDLTTYFSNDMLRLMNMKIDLIRFQNEKLNRGYYEYNLEILLVDTKPVEIKNERYFFELQVIRKMKDKRLGGIVTEISSVVEILIGKDKNGNLKIYESFEPFAPFELPDIDSLYKKEMRNRSNLDLWAEKFLKDTKADAVVRFEEIKKEQSEVAKPKIEPRTASLNRQVIVNWARNNFSKRYPKSGSSTISYYDFSTISGNFDCTNFVSHALLAGGCGMVDNGRKGITGTDQWYFRNISNRSSSWSGVNEFYRFIINNKKYHAPMAKEKTLNYNNAYLGDVVQGGDGNNWKHTTVVTGFKNNKIVLVTGRTSPNGRNNNQDATTIYSKQRLLHLEPR